jgi:hypothetical protein
MESDKLVALYKKIGAQYFFALGIITITWIYGTVSISLGIL